MKHRHPTPATIRAFIDRAIADYNEDNPDKMMPAVASMVINDAITLACEDHYAKSVSDQCKVNEQ
jgi:hypothetical protein